MQQLHEILKANIGRGVEVFFRGCPDGSRANGVIIDADENLLKLEYCIQKKTKTKSCSIYILFSEIRAVEFQTPDNYDKNFQYIKD